jgi:UDP-N-acetylglucosamine 2-epimerase (non-hydrolysing)
VVPAVSLVGSAPVSAWSALNGRYAPSPTEESRGMPGLLHVVGARPNFMKAAPVLSGCADRGLDQRCVHTGQHYDRIMSDVFFNELGIPEPDVNLGAGSGTHAEQTAALMVALESEFTASRPDAVIVYGDVNSTVAAALVAAKLHIPVAHVEAGLRSFDATMPEEINRRVTDILSDLLFVTSPEAIANLASEGVPSDRVHLVGNPMIDTLLKHLDQFAPSRVADRHGYDGSYGVVTLHRPANVDAPEAAGRVVEALVKASEVLPIVFPVHPRGRHTLAAAGLEPSERVRLIEPLGYVDFLSLVRGATAVITDSGGIQEETTVLGVPCLTLRPNTERPVTITHGTNTLLGEDPAAIAGIRLDGRVRRRISIDGWDGRAGPRVADCVAAVLAPQLVEVV